MPVSPEEMKLHQAMQREVALTEDFLAGYQKSKTAGNNVEQAFDSMYSNAEATQQLPESLRMIFAHAAFQNNPKGRDHVLDGLEFGLAEYAKCNGGDTPDSTLVTAALCEAAALLGSKEFDSALDSLSNAHHEQLSVVPEMVSVTISTRLSTGLPFMTQLANPRGSNEVPFLIANIVAGSDFGGMLKGDRLDGAKAGESYVFNKRLFAMTKVGATNEYTVAPTTQYLNAVAKTPNPAAPAAPFLGGRVVIRVNGIAVASDQAGGALNSGTSQLNGLRAKVAGSQVDISAGLADLDDHEISVTFSAALPANAVVHAEVIFDFERKDNSKNPILTRPDSEIAYEKKSIFAVPSSAQTYISVDAQSQMQNELGLSPQAAAMGQLQSKIYLEENYYLFYLLALQARQAGRVIEFDYARGADPGIAASYNTTADGIAFINTTLRTAALNIRNHTLDNGSTDIIAGDHACILLSVLAESDAFDLVEGASMNNGNVTRVGKWVDGRGLYHLPTQAAILPESATTATIMVIARGSRPELNPCVGMSAVPPTFIELNNKAFEKGVGFYCRRAVDVNPHQKYAEGVWLVDMINLPQLG